MQHFDRTGSVMQVVVQKQWWLKTWLGAGLLWWLGEPIRDFIERYLNILAIVFVVVLVGGFVAVKYLL